MANVSVIGNVEKNNTRLKGWERKNLANNTVPLIMFMALKINPTIARLEKLNEIPPEMIIPAKIYLESKIPPIRLTIKITDQTFVLVFIFLSCEIH